MKTITAILFGLLALAPWAAGAAPLMYVPTGAGGEVLVIDLDDDRIVQRIGGLHNAHGLAGQPRIHYLVAGSLSPTADGGHSVSIIDRRQGRVVQGIAVRGLTRHTALSPDGRHAIAVHPDGGGISVIDMDSMEVVETVATGEGPDFAVFSHRGRRLYVSNAQAGTISVIDTRRWKVLETIDVGGEPGHLVLSMDGKRLYATNDTDRRVVEITLPAAGVRNRIAVGGAPQGVDVSADRRWLYVTLPDRDRLLRLDLDSGARRSIPLPAPYQVELVEAVDRLYVSSRDQPRIRVLDPRTLEVLHEIDLGQGIAQQMVVIDD